MLFLALKDREQLGPESEHAPAPEVLANTNFIPNGGNLMSLC